MSDLDSFALVAGGFERLDLSWTEDVAERLLTRHPYVTGVELEGVDSNEGLHNSLRKLKLEWVYP